MPYGTDGVPLALSFGTVGLHAGRTCDGRPMGEVAIWDLLLESAVEPDGWNDGTSTAEPRAA